MLRHTKLLVASALLVGVAFLSATPAMAESRTYQTEEVRPGDPYAGTPPMRCVITWEKSYRLFRTKKRVVDTECYPMRGRSGYRKTRRYEQQYDEPAYDQPRRRYQDPGYGQESDGY